jgi:subtilisin family serine protease
MTMNSNVILTTLTVLFIHGSGAVAASPTAPAEAPYAKGRILVEAKPGLSNEELAKILAVHGGKGRKLGQTNIHIVDLPGNASEKAVVERLKHNPNLKFAELDHVVKSTVAPNDGYYGNQWHLSKVGGPAAWDLTFGAGITIAILDSGVDATHPDLVANMVPGYNLYSNNTDTSDICGHGTAVAGTAAATMNNSIGVAGIAGQAKIMPLRIAYLDSTTGGCMAYYSTIASGITYAADHGARIASCSYGPAAGSATIQSAGQYLKNKGGLLFLSAGNSGIDENIVPTTTLIAVSATDSSDNKTSWSSYGSFVSISAPGASIWTTIRGGGYQAWNGTSFSCPLAAGVAALMMAEKPSLDGSVIEKLLFSSAVDLGTAGRDPYFGNGRVNAAAGVQAALNYAAPADTQSPTASVTAPLANASVAGLVSVNVSASDNVGVSRVELRVNGTLVATDSASPYSFTWDSRNVADGVAKLVATAYDEAGNAGVSSTVSVNVMNALPPPPPTDTTAPVVVISNPVAGKISGTVNISVNATDNSGAAGISLTISIDGVIKARGTGGALSYNWNSRKVPAGAHIIEAVAKDAAGNSAKTSVQVTK